MSLILPRSASMRSGIVFLLPRLVPPTGEKGSSLWATPTARDWKDTGPNVNWEKVAKKGRLAGQVQLSQDADLAKFQKDNSEQIWPTPAAQEAGGSDEWLKTLVSKHGGPARRGERWYDPATGKHVQIGLGRAVRMWPTPKSSPSGPDYARAGRPLSGGDDLATAVARETRGQLNPRWVEWLMGYPLGWTDLEDSETESSRNSSHG